jgi:adenylosuccinate synthase
LSEIALTKLDILDALDTVKICVAYEIDGKRVEQMPYHQTDFHKAEPVYEEFAGWNTDISGCTEPGDLPPAAQDYVRAIERHTGVPVSVIGVGPGRKQFLHWS